MLTSRIYNLSGAFMSAWLYAPVIVDNPTRLTRNSKVSRSHHRNLDHHSLRLIRRLTRVVRAGKPPGCGVSGALNQIRDVPHYTTIKRR